MQCFVEKAGNDRFVDFAGMVLHRGAGRIEHNHVRDAAMIIVLAQFLLTAGKVAVEVDDHKLHAAFVFFVKAQRASRLPFGVVAGLTIHDHVLGVCRKPRELPCGRR